MNAAATALVISATSPHSTAQGPVYAPAISTDVGAKRLFFGMVTMSPGQRTKAHVHNHHESAFYLLSGDEVELWSGEALEHRAVARVGDYLFIPAKVPHVAVNRGATPAVFIGARDDPTAQESVEMRPELDSRVP